MQKAIRYLLLTGLICLSANLWAHPFHVSVIHVDWNAETHSFEVAIKVFTDDMEKALKHHGLEQVNWDAETGEVLERYFGNYFQLKAGDAELNGAFLGYEEVEDVIWSYIEIPAESLPPQLWVRADFLTEVYDDQVNILHLKTSPEKKQGTRFNAGERTYTFELN